MKFLITGDLHGKMPVFPDNLEFDAIIMPGDICGDGPIRPLVMEAYERFLANEEPVSWWEIPPLEEAKQLAQESVDQGRAILEKMNSYEVPVIVIPGNWDWTGENTDDGLAEACFDGTDIWNDLVLKGFENVIDANESIIELEECSIIGYGSVNGPELLEYRSYEVDDEDIKESREEFEHLKEFYDEIILEAKKPILFLTHNVPFNTELDIIENSQSPMEGKHYGSNLAKYICETYQPLLCIGGHIHEGHGKDMIKKTTVINAGHGSDVYSLVEIKDGKIISLELFGETQ